MAYMIAGTVEFRPNALDGSQAIALCDLPFPRLFRVFPAGFCFRFRVLSSVLRAWCSSLEFSSFESGHEVSGIQEEQAYRAVPGSCRQVGVVKVHPRIKFKVQVLVGVPELHISRLKISAKLIDTPLQRMFLTHVDEFSPRDLPSMLSLFTASIILDFRLKSSKKRVLFFGMFFAAKKANDYVPRIAYCTLS
jgi:hypothetical protein